ncbi:MAG: glutamine-hydrolyzing GMP synthase [Nitriliruptorales bacterium]|nr:glutamine-hydrolyzing GMP synthase [Nitriliruptorales bacterium]
MADFDRVLVVDLGAQYAQLIARRVREASVYSEIVPHDISPDEVKARRPAAIILSGGPKSVNEPNAPTVDPAIFELGIPILGICYGQQLLAKSLGGTVSKSGVAEYGKTGLRVSQPGILLRELPDEQTVWMSHWDAVLEPPDGFRVLAATDNSPCAAIEDPERRLYGVQFHPEVTHTPHGNDVLRRFLYDGAGCRPTWTAHNVIEELVGQVREQVGDRPVLCGLSGGVDSAVAAALVHRAVGDQLTCVFVDHGLMRHDEGAQVTDTFRGHFDVELVHVKAEDRFLEALAGVEEPEDKRKIIGEHFIRVFEQTARDIYADAPGHKFLVQGTLYPDVIESGSDTAATIKSHHNVGGLPDDMDFELVEPLRSLFKDEVRVIGRELGLPEEMVQRQPFPGPGLAVRIVGEITRERLALVRAADRIVLEELRAAGLERELWQSFAALLTVRSVGVQGDERTYGHPIVVRAVTSEDAMTADWARIPFDVLERISNRVINEVEGVNRVVLDITSKPPGTIEWE